MHCMTSQDPEPEELRGTLTYSAPEIMRSDLKDRGMLEHPNQMSRDHDQFVSKGNTRTETWSLALVWIIHFSCVFLSILTNVSGYIGPQSLCSTTAKGFSYMQYQTI